MIFFVASTYLAGALLYGSRWTGFLRFVGLPIDWRMTIIISAAWPAALVYEELI